MSDLVLASFIHNTSIARLTRSEVASNFYIKCIVTNKYVPVCWNIITQIVKKYTRDTLIPTISLKNTTFCYIYIYIYAFILCDKKLLKKKIKKIFHSHCLGVKFRL